jgi:hypothetical protein
LPTTVTIFFFFDEEDDGCRLGRMDATLFAPETIDSEQSFQQERFDVFSDLTGDGDG